MKKVIIAFDGSHFPENALEFCKKLNEINKVFVSGVFLPQTIIDYLWNFSGGVLSNPTHVPLSESIDEPELKEYIDRFEKFCLSNDIEFETQQNFFDLAIPELKRESRFADLLLLEPAIFYNDPASDNINEHLYAVLHQAECPVVLIPEKFIFPDRLILAYDGGASSVYAFRQFAYLFPKLANLPGELIYFNNKGKETIPEQEHIMGLLSIHYSNLRINRVEFDVKAFLETYLSEQKGALLIAGSFGRSDLSRFIKKSFIKEVIGNNLMPAFIAHR